MVKVSVIVPAYNVESYIARCLDSLINQTLKDVEIIIIDDGSTDKTLEIVKEYENLDTRIKVITQTNQKQGAARNRGLEIAKGEFIGFVDSDDWIDLDYFEKMYNAVIKYNVNMAAASMLREKKNKSKKHLDLMENKIYVGANNIVKGIDKHLETCGKIYRRDCIGHLRFQEGVYYEDAPYSMRAIHLSNSMVTVSDTNYHYFSNPKSTIKQILNDRNKQDKIMTNLDLIKYCEDNDIEIGDWEVLKERHFLWSIKHYKYFKIFYLFGVKILTLYVPFKIAHKNI